LWLCAKEYQKLALLTRASETWKILKRSAA
jgi:hypothetical protein